MRTIHEAGNLDVFFYSDFIYSFLSIFFSLFLFFDHVCIQVYVFERAEYLSKRKKEITLLLVQTVLNNVERKEKTTTKIALSM